METRRYEVKVESNLINDIRQHTRWFAGLGIVFLVLGVAAIAFPWVATLSLEIAIGLLLVIAGVAQAVQSFSIPRWQGFVPSLGLAVLALIVGALMLFYPLAGVFTLTLLVGVFLLVTGIVKMAFALQSKPAIGWGWILTSGVLSLILGLLILFQLTETYPWVLGLLLGIDFIFTGVWMLALATKARQLP
ncbi:HdeD family acid-resistance protein [Marinobacter salicampi]|uniref:HdeD family acid-resistance protein n=1 Tax=Marinobacter salicampi TaxID=435907 RepID=UPI00140C2414|nr:HdeD family acid-resistance protein [Marinobacter salicampi]